MARTRKLETGPLDHIEVAIALGNRMVEGDAHDRELWRTGAIMALLHAVKGLLEK